MIDRINREFDILAAQQKRLQKLSSTITIASPTLISYVHTIKTVSVLTSNLAESFTEVLNHAQIKQLNKIQTDLIGQLTSMVSSSHAAIAKIKSEKQQASNKNKTQNCSICGQNIHESNIRQALMGLQEESKQNFHMAMQQFKKIAEQPLFSKEENNQFEERLHYLLSERERVLNINCNRIEQFASIVDSALADLRKLKDVELIKNESHQQTHDYINANKISENVSLFLQESFSKKIPPWIHKMFHKMITNYIEQSNAKKMDKSIQTSHLDEIDQKDVRQIIREKQALQKENKEIGEQLRQLKLLHKRLQEINFEYAGTIATLNRNVKFKQLAPSKEGAKSRRNSKKITKIQRGDITPRDILSNLEQEAPTINQSLFQYESNHFISGKHGIEKRRKKQINSLLPQIKRNKFEKLSNLSPLSDRQAKLSELKKDFKKEQGNFQIVQPEKNDNQQILKPEEKTKANPKSQIKNEETTKNIIKNKQLIKTEKLNRDPQSSENEGDEKNLQKNKQKGKKGQPKLAQSNQKNKKSKYPEPDKKKNKPANIAKVNMSAKPNQSLGEVSVYREDEDSGIRQLYEYVANIKLNKKQKNEDSKGQQIINHTQSLDKRASKKSNLSDNKQNLETFNKRKNSQEIIILQKISRELSDQIISKRSSFYELIGLAENQKVKKENKPGDISISGGKSSEKKQIIKEKKFEERIDYEQKSSNDQEYDEEFQSEQDNEKKERNTQNDKNKKEEEPYQKLTKLRKSQNTYLINRNKHKKLSNLNITQSKIRQSLTSLTESKATQRKLFQLLKNHNVIQKSVNYNDFSTLIDKLDVRDQNTEAKVDKISAKNKSNHSENGLKDENQQRKPSIFYDVQSTIQQQAHNSVYGRLFLNRAIAHKYQQSMAKSYHKKIFKQLDQFQRIYCNKMYSQLCEAKKLKRQLYQQFCSILRYPYQTLYNNFEAVKFMSEMSLQTFQYFFRKIVWIHRKCKNQKEFGVCRHIISVREQLLEILHKNQV